MCNSAPVRNLRVVLVELVLFNAELKVPREHSRLRENISPMK